MVSSVTNGYAANPYLATTAATTNTASNAQGAQAETAAAKTSGSGDKVTLSPEAQAALAAQTDNRTTDAVIASARSELDKLLAGAKGYRDNQFKIELAQRAVVRALNQAAAGTAGEQT